MMAAMALVAEPSRLLVFQVAEGVAKDCGSLARTFRGPGAFARADQLVRASLSVVSNIAEGCGRGSVADFRRFLLIARGSAHELLVQLRLIEARTPEEYSLVSSLKSRGFLVLKLLTRLHAHPPPEK
jgi:four helix bundle protein